MRDLILVEEGLTALEDRGVRVTVYKRYVSSWRRMVLSYPYGWGQAVQRENVYSQSAIDQLDTLADWFDDRLPAATSEQKQKLGSITESAQSILDADETLSPVLRKYIGRLLREIRNALDDEQLGERFDYESAAQRLWVTLIAAADQSTDPDQKTRWQDTTRRFLWDASVSAIGNAPGVFLALSGLS